MRRFWIPLIALSFVASPARAEWKKISSKDFPLPAPPAAGSAAYEKDFEILKKMQTTRSEADCELVARQEFPTFQSFFPANASPLSEAERLAAGELTETVMALAERVAGYHKDRFRRPRPYDVNPALVVCGKKPGGSKAYPSSHATAASAAACVLATLFPEKKDALLGYGEKLGSLRVVAAVHHPSNVEAGASLGRSVCERLLKEADFLSDLEEVLTQETR